MKQYNSTIAIMKGIAISAVVLGHCASFKITEQFLNQWHLAVFFFVSGYLLKVDGIETGYIKMVKKKVDRLLLPYLLACVIFISFHNVLYRLGIYDTFLSGKDMTRSFMRLALLTTDEPLLGAMWFCPVLLIMSGIFLTIFRMIAYFKVFFTGQHIWIWLLMPYVLSSFLLYGLHLRSPYCIWQIGVISIFFAVGYIFRLHEEKIRPWIYRSHILTGAFLLIALGGLIMTTCYGVFARLQPFYVNKESFIAIPLIGLLGVGMVYVISDMLSRFTAGRKVLAFIGNYSFSIMLLHFIAFKFVIIIQCWCKNISFSKISSFPTMTHTWAWTALYLIAGIFLPIFFSWLSSRAIVAFKVSLKDKT